MIFYTKTNVVFGMHFRKVLGPFGRCFGLHFGMHSGWGLSVVGGYSWYFENDISVILGTGPLFSSESKESENIKSDKGFGKDADERVEKLSFLPLVPLLFVGFSF